MKKENEDQKITITNDLKSSRSSMKWFSKLTKKNRYSKERSQVVFNLDSLGEIEFAKLHREANRPLRKIKDFDKNTKFCPCCSLPVEQKGYIERFNFCENTDDFSDCGRGISLYFSYFRFAILISSMAFISMALPTIIMTYKYTYHLAYICGKIYEDHHFQDLNETFPECVPFAKLDSIDDSLIYDDEMLYFNSINLKEYRILISKGINPNINIDKILFNYSIIYFISLISLFVINLFYIILLNNINKQYDLLVTSPSDYTVVITNLHSAFHIFWKKINKINDIIKERNNNNKSEVTSKSTSEEKQIKENKLKEELGLENFPQNKEINILEGFHQFIKNKICENSKGYNFRINQINVCYKIGEYMKIEEKIQEKKKQIIMATYDPKQQMKNEDLEYHERKYFYTPLNCFGLNILCCDICKKSILLSDIQEEKQKLEKELEESIKLTEKLTEENFAGIIFITFETMDEQEKFLEPYPKNLIMNILIKIKDLKYYLCKCLISKEKQKRFFLKKNLEVHVAPEPEDVIYENLQYSSLEKGLRVFLTFFLSFLIIGVCFILILGINNLQIKYRKNSKFNKKVVKYGLSLLITGVIFIINMLFQIGLGHLTKIEKQSSMTDHYLSLSIKLTIITFITSAIVPFISDYYINNEGNYNLLVTNMATCFISNCILTPLFWIFNINYLFKQIQICYIEKKGKHNLTQRELNSLYELPDMEIAFKYSYIVRTLLMAFFYMPIFPFSMLISSIGFILGYYLEKYNFTTKYKRPEMLNSKICEFYSNYFIVNFFMLGIGDYIFLSDNRPNNNWPICNIILFGLLILIPYNQIFNFDFLGINESDLKQEKYEDIYFTFYNDYERSNPMTKKEGIKRFINKLKEKNFIKEQEFDKIYENIENINLMEIYYDSRKLTHKNSIRRNFTRKSTIIKQKSNYISSFNNYVKQNKEMFLDYLLSLGKKQTKNNNNIKENIVEEYFNEKNNTNSNKSENDNQYDLDENNYRYESNPNNNYRMHSNNYKESEQKINMKDNDSISSIKINVKNNNKNANYSNFKPSNNYKYRKRNNNNLYSKTPNKKEKYIFSTSNENLYDYNENINNKYKKRNNKNNNFQNDIDIYQNQKFQNYKYKNKYNNKKEFQFKKYSKNILTGYDINKNEIHNINYNKNNNKDIFLGINNKKINYINNTEINNNQNMNLFNNENYDNLHNKILNQYKNSTNSSIFNLDNYTKFNEQIYWKKYQEYQNRYNNKNLDDNN